MAVPIALMAAGTALQLFGNLRANYAQAEAEAQNAAYYEDQANFVKEAMFREGEIAAVNYEARKGAQISAVFRGGADLSGSAAGIVAETIAQKSEELTAIRSKGELDFKLAKLRQRTSENAARELKDPLNNLLQGATILTKNLSANAEIGSGLFNLLGGTQRSTAPQGAVPNSNPTSGSAGNENFWLRHETPLDPRKYVNYV